MLVLFGLMALIIIISSLGVVLSKNPVYSALWLVTNLLTVAAVFASLNAHFLAAAQIIVYAGAIMVLFVFVIMLLNLKAEQPTVSALSATVATLLGLGLVAIFGSVILAAFKPVPGAPLSIDPAPVVNGSAFEIGKLMYTEYLFPFEIASLLIIAAVIGAVMLAKKKGAQGKLKAQISEG